MNEYSKIRKFINLINNLVGTDVIHTWIRKSDKTYFIYAWPFTESHGTNIAKVFNEFISECRNNTNSSCKLIIQMYEQLFENT